MPNQEIICSNCLAPLTPKEVEYYGVTCEVCEGKEYHQLNDELDNVEEVDEDFDTDLLEQELGIVDYD